MPEPALKNILAFVGDEEHNRRMKVARERAQWELGDSSWASVIVGAYLYPEEDAQALAREKGD